MKTQKTFGSGLLTTVNPSKYGAQATGLFDTLWRPLQWTGGSATDENNQRMQNDFSLVTLLDTVPMNTLSLTNPSVAWRVDNRKNLFTALAQIMSSSDTYISVEEPALALLGWNLVFPSTGQSVLVVDTDSDLSEGWTNGAAKACNVKVSRSTPGPSVAAVLGAEIQPALPMLGESGEPKKGINIVPGDPLFNFCKFSGLRIDMTKQQHNSLMAGEYGTHEHLLKTNEHLLATMLQNSILHDIRGNREDSDEGMVYSGNGILAQIQSNVLDVGTVGNALAYGELSDFIDGTYDSANSSEMKTIVAGAKSFMNFLNSARQENAIADVPHYNPALGVDEFTLTTGGGKSATIQNHRFAMEGEMADSAIVLDLGQMEMGEYQGFEGWQWQMDLNANTTSGLMVKTDAVVGSTMTVLKDPDCFGFIRGGVTPRLKNRNDLGIV